MNALHVWQLVPYIGLYLPHPWGRDGHRGDHYLGERGGDVDMAWDSDRSNLRAGLHPLRLPLAPASDSLLESLQS